MRVLFLQLLVVLFANLAAGSVLGGKGVFDIVKDGKIVGGDQIGKPWTEGDGFAEGWAESRKYLFIHGTTKLLSKQDLGKGDFHIKAKMSITPHGPGSSFDFAGDAGNNVFGFNSKGTPKLYFSGPDLNPGGKRSVLGKPSKDFYTDGKPFLFEVVRKDNVVRFLFDGKEAHSFPYAQPMRNVGFAPYRVAIRLYSFSIEGNVVANTRVSEIEKTLPVSFTIPNIDISDTDRQVVIARGSGSVYQGHPHTLLMPDGKTMFCVWTLNHGPGAPRMSVSHDAGKTWQPHPNPPANWGPFGHCPTIHRLTDPSGAKRLVLMDGLGDFGQSVSTDGGKTWSEMKKNGVNGVVAPITIAPVDGGAKLLLWTHRQCQDSDDGEIWQSESTDGGLTWRNHRPVCRSKGASLCEPAVIPSPDGKQLLCLMRENHRRLNSLYMTSDDDGQTWSDPKELPAALTGDRHLARYTDDGRIVCVFRDTAKGSPTPGSFAGWVGTYDDILSGRQGQYRLRLLKSYGEKLGDLGYPGLEQTPDGTIIATTYARLGENTQPSVVSVRFTLAETDKLAENARDKKETT